jgi:hypothetical protein
MAEERITEVETPSGNTHTSHTIVERDPDRRGGGSGWLIAVILVLALLIGGYFLMQNSNSDVAKDNAVAEAAQDVGNAANQVGDAAQNAANNLNK